MTTGATAVRRGRLMREVGPADWQHSRMGQFAREAGRAAGLDFTTYDELWNWSVSAPDEFWRAVVSFFDLSIADLPADVVSGAMPEVTWMPQARLNYARDALRHSGPEVALIGLSQTRAEIRVSRDELRAQVAACRAGLVDLGVGRGDAVAAYLPNIPETVILFLATASLGAVFASCPPEFGVRAVLDRFGQVEPKVLVASSGYVYGHRTVDTTSVVAELANLPGLDALVLMDYADVDAAGVVADSPVTVSSWSVLLARTGDLAFEDVAFDHPLYVLFSSGSTGRPKAIVHGHGGILLEHAKALGLHNDVRPGDRFFWYATTGWMVWNYAVSALIHGAAMVCFDGNPSYPDGLELWRAADATGATFFGTSATHVVMSASNGLEPAGNFEFEHLRDIAATGSPLPAEGFEWLEHAVSRSARISSVSGGTDVCSGFVGGSPLTPTRAGELSAPMLGCRPVALDENGQEVIGQFAELCVTTPMPSMPVAFLDDPDCSRLVDAYYSKYPGMWAHGDWAMFFTDGACVISGRSDTTLNRGGVRLGTSDIYGVVDAAPSIDDSLIVHLEDPRGGAGTLLLLLAGAVVAEGARPEVEADLTAEIRRLLSPRHVPDRIAWVEGLPRTLTGKKLEKPVKQLLLGADPETVASAESLSDPALFAKLATWAQQYRATNSGGASTGE